MSDPDPLTPEDCDLRDFPFMLIDIGRLFGSEFHAECNDAEWRAGVTLWLKSFHQVPAGSLPDNDISLCRLAELGRDLKTWGQVKANALRGWKRANDGRLYHRVVAEKVLEAWLHKLNQRLSSGAGHEARYGIPFSPEQIKRQIEHATQLLARISPHSKAFAKIRRRQAETSRKDTNGTANGIPGGIATGTPDQLPPTCQET